MAANLSPADVGTTALASLLSVRDGARAIEFYKTALGAAELFRVTDPGGAVVARLSVSGAEFWLADESPEHANLSPASLGGSTVRIVLTVERPDELFAQAIAADAVEVYAVADQPYGWRVGRLTDPFGHHWAIGKPLCGGRSNLGVAVPPRRPEVSRRGAEAQRKMRGEGNWGRRP